MAKAKPKRKKSAAKPKASAAAQKAEAAEETTPAPAAEELPPEPSPLKAPKPGRKRFGARTKRTEIPDKAPPLGQALLQDGAITEPQLQRALRVQKSLEQHRQLGDVLVELGMVTRQTIADAIAAHGQTMRLGDILVEQGLITSEDLSQCLELQKEDKKPVGELLVQMGAINERTLLQNLARQGQVPYIEPTFAMIDSGLLTGLSPDYLERNLFLPFSKGEDDILTVIVADLRDDTALHAIEDIFRDKFKLALGPRDAIEQSINEFRVFQREGAKGRKDETRVEEDAVVLLVNHIIEQAVEDRASDIHIEPMLDRIRLRYRIDGVLVYKTDLPLDMQAKLMSRIKIMANCDIAETRRHQGGRINYQVNGVDFDLRISIYISVHGESAVFRVLNAQKGLIGLHELGMTPTMLERFREDVLDMPTGVVLVTGPTGSGKTTTLYSALDYSNDTDTKIITVEDPVEYMIDGLVQGSVFEKVGRSFQSCLREIVRQDPDIIVLGEIRDKVTCETAIEAALTGHKVYSTFHTEDTIGGLVRLLNMEIDAFLISSTLISVVAQRLLRRICNYCEIPYQPTPKEVRNVGLDPNDVREFELKKGRGCKHCNFTGYFGRVAVYELLVLNEAVKEAVLEHKPAHIIRDIGVETGGLVSMREDGISKAIHGLTTFQEVLRMTPSTARVRPLRQVLALTH